jgi:hypothetical protein
MTSSELLNINPYTLDKKEKRSFLMQELSALSKHHYDKCTEYRRMMKAVNFDPYTDIEDYTKIPALPIRLFKELSLKSIPDSGVAKTMTSSGTSGQTVSKLYLDRETATLQQNVGVKITTAFLGLKKRLPMIIIDSSSLLKSREIYSARAGAVLFYQLFGSDKIYALDDDMNFNYKAVEEFLEKHNNSEIFLFGFTFMVWQHFYNELNSRKLKLDLSKGTLIHSGGWKKLAGLGITNDVFKSEMHKVCKIERTFNQYGTAEQSGCVCLECEHGYLHHSVYSDVTMRRAKDLSACEIGEPGIIESYSVLPRSYPGHVILVEDEGILLGEDDCPCGRKGKYFKVIGRLKNAEIRGCGDTYAQNI